MTERKPISQNQRGFLLGWGYTPEQIAKLDGGLAFNLIKRINQTNNKEEDYYAQLTANTPPMEGRKGSTERERNAGFTPNSHPPDKDVALPYDYKKALDNAMAWTEGVSPAWRAEVIVELLNEQHSEHVTRLIQGFKEANQKRYREG